MSSSGLSSRSGTSSSFISSSGAIVDRRPRTSLLRTVLSYLAAFWNLLLLFFRSILNSDSEALNQRGGNGGGWGGGGGNGGGGNRRGFVRNSNTAGTSLLRFIGWNPEADPAPSLPVAALSACQSTCGC